MLIGTKILKPVRRWFSLRRHNRVKTEASIGPYITPGAAQVAKAANRCVSAVLYFWRV